MSEVTARLDSTDLSIPDAASSAQPDNSLDKLILRYTQQVVLKVMNAVRAGMRGSDRLSFKEAEASRHKEATNLTKAIDLMAEDMMFKAIRKKFAKIPDMGGILFFSEEAGLVTHPEGLRDADVRWVVFMDPIDGTEFIETLQGGWCLLSVFDRLRGEVSAVVAGDIFLDRLYWAGRGAAAECLDFASHSWFHLDGGPHSKSSLQGARLNVLTTKPSRFTALAGQRRLLKALEESDGRINLASGSNVIIQVAAGNADVALEFAKGFATYDLLPGLYLGLRAGLTILDLEGNPLTQHIDIEANLSAYRANSKKPLRTAFVAAKSPQLARLVLDLLDLEPTA